MNCAVYSGKLMRDPELTETRAGAKQASFTLIVHRPRTKDVCDFIDCVAWDEKAEFVMRNFKKGSVAEVKGITITRSAGRDGARKITELRVDEASFGRDISRLE